MANGAKHKPARDRNFRLGVRRETREKVGLALELDRTAVELLVQVNGHTERRAGPDKCPVLERPNLSQHQRRRCFSGQAPCGLHHGFEHHHARKDRIAGKMVLQILLGIADVLVRDDAGGALFDDRVEKLEMHTGAYSLRSESGDDRRCIRRDPVLFFGTLPTVHDDAFCIRVWDWSETSQTVSLFCRAHGVVRGLAKGAKRDDARFSGGFELFTRGQVGLILKSTDAMATLTAWDLTETFTGARANLSAFYAAMAMLDLVHHMIRDHDPHPVLFDALASSANKLSKADRALGTLAGFLWEVLVESGYRPELERDVRSSESLDLSAPLAFDARLGGFTRWEKGAADEGWRVRPQTLEVLRALALRPHALAPSDDLLRAAKLLSAYVRETAGGPIPSVDGAMRAFSV